jgi:hypothetical protein
MRIIGIAAAPAQELLKRLDANTVKELRTFAP